MTDDRAAIIPVSVIIPAHDEEAVIARCLRALVAGAHPGELEIIVVCNGCRDATAEVARAAYGEALVLEVPGAGKAGALTLGDAQATRFPRLYLDADIEVGIDAVRAVARSLTDGSVLCAAPRPEFVLDGRPWAVRAFYRVWSQLPYMRSSMVGSGLYALASAGRERFGDFPQITADDQFVMQLFAEEERAAVDGERFRLHTPTRLRGLLQMRRRVYRGNRELAASGMALHRADGRPWPELRALARRPAQWAALGVYLGVNLTADLLSRRAGGPAWERDESSRSAPDGPRPTVAYLTSRYPAVSHTFVLREVAAVRAAGVEVETFSVVAAAEADLLSDRDRREASRTIAIRPISATRLAVTHLGVALRHPGAWTRTLLESVRIAPPGLRAKVWQVFYFAEAVVLFDACRRRGVRHVHAHFANVAADLAWLCATLGRRIDPAERWTWSMTMHGPTEFFDAGRHNLAAKAVAAELVICISDFCRSQLMAFTPPSAWSRFEVVHTGTDLDRYHPDGPGAGGDGGPLRILNVGRLHPVKGQTVLLDALRILLDRGVDARLVLVGDGPAAADVRARVDALGLGEVVTLAGAVGQDEMPELYRSADVFCLSSFAEGVPVVLMEAMATALAVVTTNVNGIPELVEHGRQGLLVPPGRPDALADALAQVSASALRQELGRRAREKVAREFDAWTCGAMVAERFRRLLQERAASH